ncbi:protein DpdE [Variovorax sp. J22R133]|uniref:protein DpdE n=1 Tax=Variovorax brevis TaxID=3053503 RepID=UPI002574B4AC|nr:protein DpdE [Variovorax sp. J22R133]MDM0115665.1 protein DpdE [Variovorax sp. J22R133]
MTFVVSNDALELGLGRLIEQGNQISTVEFFDHPGEGGRLLHKLPTRGLQPRRLELQARVYVCDDEGRWLAGRIVEILDNRVEVRIGPKQSVEVPVTEIMIRWGKPIADPVPFLAQLTTEPVVASNSRRQFLQEAIHQRALGAGIDGLLSSAVELEPYQMAVVRRVLTDPVQRYLLADEVGLGKTVEAGAIIRQHVIDDPQGHRITVVVPEGLVSQWRHELTHRFHVGPPYLDDSIQVVHLGTDDLDSALSGARLIVVDEAHHIVGRHSDPGEQYADQREAVRVACHRAEALLLLSATPAIADEDSFFELMQLIDPDVYPPEEREAFRQRIQHRHELGQLIAGFEPDAMDFLADDGQRLCELFPQDEHLARLVGNLTPIARAASDPAQPDLVAAVQAIREHLSETYRLHRRILRNRRKNVQGVVTPIRNGATTVEYHDATAGVVAQLIDQWRLVFAGTETPDQAAVYLAWMRALLETPATLRSLVDSYTSDSSRQRQLESDSLRQLQAQLEHWNPQAARLLALDDALARTDVESKVVIFCTSQETADACFEHLKFRHSGRVVRHNIAADDEEFDDAPAEWTRFLSKPDCRYLVCDARAEEGLNLQGGKKVVLHFDLPFSPNRIEQRIGRVDRFGSGDPIETVVLACADNKAELAWAHCVTDGFGIGDQSIASLQYLVDAQMDGLQQVLFTDGAQAIVALKDRLGSDSGEIRRELKRIDEQDELEALQTNEEEHGFDDLFDMDADWERIRGCVEPWLQHGLQFNRLVEKDGRPTIDEVVRYWQTHSTLITRSRLQADFTGALDTEMGRRNQGRLTTQRFAYRRQTSVNRSTHLMRVGDSLFEGLLHAAMTEDRGRVAAIWRSHPRYRPISGALDVFFRLDFVVEADLAPALELFPRDSSHDGRRNTLRRRMDLALAPRHHSVWLDRSLQPVEQDFIDKWLDLRIAQGEYPRDVDIGATAWRRLREGQATDILRDWPDLVAKAGGVARDQVLQGALHRDHVEECVAQMKLRDETTLVRLESRLATLRGHEKELETGRVAFEKLLNAQLLEGVQQPKLTLDAISAVFLAMKPLG